MFQRCPYCHRWVLAWFYTSHKKKHNQRRSDGQLVDHVTAAPESRYAGSLDDFPQNYRHSVCGAVTQMPEGIIRTYLVTPLAYNDGSFCCGCNDYVESSQLVWEETGEKVMDYMGGLRLAYLRTKLGMSLPDRPTGVVVTPRAELKINDALSSMGTSAVLELLIPQHGSTDFRFKPAPSFDKQKEKMVGLSGARIVVANEVVRRAAGIVIDYREAPEAGFSISRLYAPSLK